MSRQQLSFWHGHPLDGGREIPGELTEAEDGTYTFRPHLMPTGTTENVYVQHESEQGRTTIVPLNECAGYE